MRSLVTACRSCRWRIYVSIGGDNTIRSSCRLRSCLQQPAVPQRPLQRRLHLHVTQLGDSEVEVLDRDGALVGIVLQQQLGEVEAYEGDFGTEPHFLADIQGFEVVTARFRRVLEQPE